MKTGWCALVLAGCLAGGAQAQTATCQNYGSYSQCQLQPQPNYGVVAPPSPFESMETVGRLLMYRQQLEAVREAQAQAGAEAGQRRIIGRMVAEGRCDDAKRFALALGRFDIAEEAVRVCTPASAVAAAPPPVAESKAKTLEPPRPEHRAAKRCSIRALDDPGAVSC